MPDLVVIDHHHDPGSDVYCIVIGYAIPYQIPKFDEAGEPVMGEPQPAIAHLPKLDDEGKIVREQVPVLRPKLDDNGLTVLDDQGNVVSEPQIDETGNPVTADGPAIMEDRQATDDEGNLIFIPPAQLTEEVIHYIPMEDFLFTADDERWAGLGPDEIATVQRNVIRNALEARVKAANAEAARTSKVVRLPGVGDAL